MPGSMPKSETVESIRHVTLWGMVVNLGLTALKIAVGVLGSSQALVADGVHSLSDVSTDTAVLLGVRFWAAPADMDHPHGHGRIETLVSLFIGVVLAAAGIGLGFRAIATLHERHISSPGWIAFAAACFSIAFKELLYRWTARVGKRVRSKALAANAWHHRSDALSSVPVAVAVVGTHVWPAFYFLDHVAAVIVCVLILGASWRIAWPALRELTDAGAGARDRKALLALAAGVKGVCKVHALRTRRIGSGLAADLHVLVPADMTVKEGHDVAKAVEERLLKDGPDLIDVLVHVEPYDSDATRPTAPPE